MSHRIVQISDPHLTCSRDGLVRGVPTWRTLDRVLASVDRQVGGFDRLVITGDIAQDEQPATYAMLAQVLGECMRRTRAIPGNHDDPFALAGVFPPSVRLPGGGFVDRVGNWRIVGLSSHVAGRTDGAVGWVQRCACNDWMRREPASPTIVFVHHPPVRVGTGWLDPIGLEDGAALLESCRTHPRIRAVFHGHTHQVSSVRHGKTPVFGAPSTAFQFVPGSTTVELDQRSPGYRVIELDGERFTTRVVRVD